MDSIDTLLLLVPALPLAAAIIIGLLGARTLRENSHYPVIIALVISCVCSLMLLGKVSEEGAKTSAGYERVVTLWTWAEVGGAYDQTTGVTEADNGLRDFRVDITLRADALTAIMLSMVTFISALVAIFAAGYMHGDRGYWRFFAYIGLFVFSMTMLVSVSSFVLLFIFWEAVGVCSYLLIGFWYEKPEAAAAGKKAFLVNRVGDFGFALALFLIWTTYGTLNFHDTLPNGETVPGFLAEVSAKPTNDNVTSSQLDIVQGVLGQRRIETNNYRHDGIATAICLLLLLGACGKSAQFPLHVWLPDAMEGPTPVSALIHAATMVTAGVYMVTRCTPLFMASPDAQLTVACVGGFTALLAGLIALTQYDLKRVLAYSTVSQLGYMFLALGVGTVTGITAGMFHLFTHAFFKALLFLGAGSVMHAMGNVIDMRRFGGLRKLMPVTHATFLVGCLALAGFPPLSGFFSKDSIVAAVHDRVHALHDEAEQRHAEHADGAVSSTLHMVSMSEEPTEGRSAAFDSWSDEQIHRFATIYHWLFYSAMFTAFLTAFYTFRAFYMTFYGKEVIPHDAGHHAHESPKLMTAPLIVLAVGAFFVGGALDQTIAGGPHHFGVLLLQTPSLAGGVVSSTHEGFLFHENIAGMSVAIAFAAFLIATYLYLGRQREINFVRSMLDFEGFNVEAVSKWQQVPWIAATHRRATALRLGWLTSLIGNIVLLIALVLATPFLIGHFISPYKLSLGKFFIDEFYNLVIVLPLRGIAATCYLIDRWIVDGAVNLVGRIPVLLGGLMRSLQMGLVQFYALAMVLGIVVVFVARAVLAS